MGILEDILATQKEILAALSGGGTVAKTADKPATKPATKPAAAKGPTLEIVQDKIRTLAEQEGMKDKIKAAITKLGGKRAGDFESDAAKLTKLDAALDALAVEGDEDPVSEDDDDLL